MLLELARVFLWLGATSFGGPAAHIAVMQREFVDRRAWLSRQEFLDLLAATNLIPGPNSTEMAMHIGYKRGGPLGLIVSGVCFIVPAAALVTVIAAAYVAYGELPRVDSVLYAIKPVVIAIVAKAMVDLGRSVIHSKLLVGIVALAVAINMLGLGEIILIIIMGLVVLGLSRFKRSTAGVGTLPLFTFFLKVGAALYGSGYVLIALLQTDLVERYQWLSRQQLLDAVAVGQFTPGPLFTTATFIGYILFGFKGALAATVGIFLPSFVLVYLSQPLVRRIGQFRWATPFLQGVNAAAIGLILTVVVSMAGAAIVDPFTAATALVSGLILVTFEINSAWLVLIAGLVGGIL